jgi:hypothetical protein
MATLADLLRGYGETALTLGTGAIAAPLGGAYGVYKNVTSPYFGTQKGINLANKEAGKVMESMTYQPRGQKGQQNLQELNVLFNQSKLPPILPEMIGFAPLLRKMPLSSKSSDNATLAPIETIKKGIQSETGTGFFDTGDIRRVGQTQPNLNPARLTPDELRSVQGNIEIPNLRRSDAATLAQILRNPDLNPSIQLARDINPNFNLDAVKAMSPSSLQKQFPIAKTYETMAKGIDPALERQLFAQYLRSYPEAVKKSGATNYQELIPASYEQLGIENAKQLDRMLNQNMKLSYHQGDLNYANSPQMLEDALINRHLYVFGGGEPHQLLNKIDPYTGLNQNQVFRAVHDYYGHGPSGASFGPKGEELAYGTHSQLYSPLAKMAAATETRGQNSFVNFSGINAQLQQDMAAIRQARENIARQGGDTAPYDAKLAELGAQTQYADQRAFLLPPEMIDPMYQGGMPDYMQPFIQPNSPSALTGYHYSNRPDLLQTDPSMYGTGIRGAEAKRLTMADALRDRTYFYNNPNTKEAGLGPNQYEANLTDFYNVAQDPDNLKKLARQYNQYQSIVDENAATNALERIAKEAGYEGIITPTGAISFQNQKVTPTSLVEIYHGTSPKAAKAIEKSGFDVGQSADGSIWFTSNPNIGEVSATGKGAIIKKQLDKSKLKLGGWDETDKYSTNELIDQGYDGLMLKDGDNITYQIFNPEKLK